MKIYVESMENGRNVKCPRCWRWHGVVDNLSPDPKNAKERFCDRCTKIMIEDFPEVDVYDELVLNLNAQRKKYTVQL